MLKQTSIIYRALLKYGYKNFRLDILEYCLSKDEIINKEQYYIYKLKPSYNICKIAGSSLGRLASKVTRSRLRNALVLRSYKSSQDNLKLFEHKINYMTKKLNKLELAILILEKKVKSLNQKPVFKESYEVRFNKLLVSTVSVRIKVLYLKTGQITEYLSARSAGLVLNASSSTILNKIKGKNNKPYKGRYVISKLNEG